jgi:predicted ATPase
MLRRPFRLDAQTNRPSRFEIELILDGVRHEYGFVVDDTTVLREWARRYPRGKAATIFERTGQDLRIDNRSAKGRAMRELLRDDALFLSVASAADYQELGPLYRWFEQNFRHCDASSRDARSKYTAQLMEDEGRRQQILGLLQIADLGIVDACRRKPSEQEMAWYRKVYRALTAADDSGRVLDPDFEPESLMGIELTHRGADGSIVILDSEEESLGTLVWLGLVGPLLDSLINGTVILVDELEASLHPLLVEQFVRIFQDHESNPNGAQLIFNSHEARLLGIASGDRVIGRDQAWFTEKREDGSTSLYSLADLNPRKAEAIARRYLEGRYGATPIISPGRFTALAAMLATGAQQS